MDGRPVEMETQMTTAAQIPTVNEEVTRILEDTDSYSVRVKYVGADTWSIRLRHLDLDEGEEARLALVDDLMETLGDDACEGMGFRSRTIPVTHHYQRSGGTTLSVLDVDTEEKVILIGNFPGVRVTYRWRERPDSSGFRFVEVADGGAR
jgi:hypothetical protein